MSGAAGAGSGEWDPHEVGLGGTRMSGSCEWDPHVRWGSGVGPARHVGQGPACQVPASGTHMPDGGLG